MFLVGTVSNHLALTALFALLRHNLALFALGSRANSGAHTPLEDRRAGSSGAERGYIDAMRQNPLFLSKPQAWYGITLRRVWNCRRRMASPKVYSSCVLIPCDTSCQFHSATSCGFHTSLRDDYMLAFGEIKHESEEGNCNYGKKKEHNISPRRCIQVQ